MTEQQAIKRFKSEMEWESIELNREAFSMGIKALKEIQQYRAIGTVEELQALKEKSVAKKPIFIKRSVTQFYACPHCSTNEHYQWVYPKVKYCDECGGCLDWE